MWAAAEPNHLSVLHLEPCVPLVYNEQNCPKQPLKCGCHSSSVLLRTSGWPYCPGEQPRRCFECWLTKGRTEEAQVAWFNALWHQPLGLWASPDSSSPSSRMQWWGCCFRLSKPWVLLLPSSNLLVFYHIPRQAAAWKASSLMLFSKILKHRITFLLAELLIVTMKGGKNQTAGKTDCRYWWLLKQDVSN